jgi:hypothetical protein
MPSALAILVAPRALGFHFAHLCGTTATPTEDGLFLVIGRMPPADCGSVVHVNCAGDLAS